jgi:hypothetical protein
MLPMLTLSHLKRNQPKVMLLAALVRTIQHLIPVLRPGFAPGHLAPAGLAQLAGQVLFVAFEAGFICPGCGWSGVVISFFGHERILSASNKLDNNHHQGYFDDLLIPLVKI